MVVYNFCNKFAMPFPFFKIGMKVAGFVSSPLLSAPKTVSHEWMHVSDWYPTILNLAGGSTEGLTLDGFDQWPAISGSAPSPRKVWL